MHKKSGYENQYIFIAGAFQGVGFELAKMLLFVDAYVGVIGRDRNKGALVEKTFSEIESKHPAKVFYGDLSIPKVVEQTQKQVHKWCKGTLHHLIVFLGSGKTSFGYDFPVSHWQQVFHTNLFSPIGVVQSFIPLLTHGKGNPSITLTGAIAGVERVRAPMTYSVAKTALIAYANHLAEALLNYNIRVFTISPGNVFFKGGRWEEILAERKSEIDKFLETQVGMKRLGSTKELAWIYFTTISPNNSFMTGQNIIVDGLQIRKIF